MKKEGFAAHLITISGTQHKSAIAIVGEDEILLDIIPLDRETPFTKFYDGALTIHLFGSDLDQPVSIGDRIEIWQWYPYDLFARVPMSYTRKLRVK